MALADLDVKAGYEGDGATVSFAIPFADSYWAEEEVVVIYRDVNGVESILAQGVGYTLTGEAPPTTPLPTTVVTASAPAIGSKIYIVRLLALIQAYTFTGQSVNPRTLTTALDKLLARIQQIDEANDRSPKLDVTSIATSPSMEDPTADCVLAYSADGTRIVNGPTVEEVAAAEGYAEAAQQSSEDAFEAEEAALAAQAAAEAALLGMTDLVPGVTGSRAVPSDVVAATGIAFTGTKWFNTWYIQGSGGAADVAANPQIAPGTNVGQRLRLIARSDVNTVTLEDGTGLELNGMWVGDTNSSLDLEWNGTNWWETGRR